MNVYNYTIDNNEYYSEDSSEFDLLSFEEISAEEFEQIVKDAFDACADEDGEAGYATVAREILKRDKRFFLPVQKSIAFVGHENRDYSSKIRGFSHK